MAHTPHLLLPGPWERPSIPLDDGHLDHLRRVLRRADGEALTYTDGAGTVGRGGLAGSSVIRGDEQTVPRPALLTVAVAPPASKQRARWVVEKLAELGVARLAWVRTAHTEGRAPSPVKTAAWAAAALEQSRGGWLMSVGTASIDELPDPLVLADGSGSGSWPERVGTIVVGPEGGFAPFEMEGRATVSLGPTVLRVETAAVVAATLATRAPTQARPIPPHSA